MLWIWISVIFISVGGFLRFLKNEKKITKILTFSVALFILIVFFAGLNKDPRYKTKNLTGNTIKNFELSSFNSNEIINQEILKKANIH